MNISKNFEKFRAELDKAIKESIENHEKEIKPQILAVTPKDTGQLRESYKFEETENSQQSYQVVQYRISFGPVVGDNGENYAAQAHEWIDYTNPPEAVGWTTPGTGHKFLQRPVLETAPMWLNQVRLSYKKLESKFSGGKR